MGDARASGESLICDADLGAILDQLNLAEYLERLRADGFESWGDVLDITEGDLKSLGVKLGHRRRLQRRIASERGVPTDREIVYTSKQPPNRPNGEACPTKRRYRRHAKPDIHAPKPPLTAYAQFANDRRYELRDRGLSFAQLAIEIGKLWRTSNEQEQEHYRSQAAAAKDDHQQALTKYKKSEEYKQYQEYLQDWKAKERARAKGQGDQDDFEVSSIADDTSQDPSSPTFTTTTLEDRSATNSSTDTSVGFAEPWPAVSHGQPGFTTANQPIVHPTYPDHMMAGGPNFMHMSGIGGSNMKEMEWPVTHESDIRDITWISWSAQN